MKAKTLLLSATLAVAGVMSAAAQTVYSVNVVGYANVVMPPGWTIIANPLNAPTNTVGVLFAGIPENFKLFKFDKTAQTWVVNAYEADPFSGLTAWQFPDQAFAPGEGFFAYNPSAASITNTFVGEVVQGTNLTVGLVAGFALVSSIVPQEGLLQTDLAFVPQLNDKVFTFANGAYSVFPYEADPFSGVPGWSAGEPTIKVGEGFWVYSETVRNWTRNFTVPQN